MGFACDGSSAAATPVPGRTCWDFKNWSVFQIAAVSSITATDIANKRKFLFPPDIVFTSDATGPYAAILIGSGDREHAFATTISDRF